MVMVVEPVRRRVQRMLALLLGEAARPLRFLITGGTAGVLQLAILWVLTERGGWHPLLANLIAFLLSAQLNFALSVVFTWHDRRSGRLTRGQLLTRWIAFHGSIAGSAALNQVVAAAARLVLPTLEAAMVGIIVAAGVNFLSNDRLIFRHHPEPTRAA
jgi:putative flippase GtrA